MLPEKLSNNLCSLVPYQDRLTFSAVFVFDEKDKIVSRWFGKTVIHSAKRFSYEEAQTILDDQPAEALKTHPSYEQLEWAVKTLNNACAKKMRKERENNGAIGFETEEVRFRFAEDGTPMEAYVKERKDAHLLIEDFMLLANKEVAWFIEQKAAAQQEIPFVYRVHDLPDMEKVAEFARFAAEMGHKMKVDTPKHIAQSFKVLMQAAQTDDRLKVLEPLAIRTMAKAVYSYQQHRPLRTRVHALLPLYLAHPPLFRRAGAPHSGAQPGWTYRPNGQVQTGRTVQTHQFTGAQRPPTPSAKASSTNRPNFMRRHIGEDI